MVQQRVVFHRHSDKRDGGRSEANVPWAETGTASVDVVVVNVIESSNRHATTADAADDHWRDNGVVITVTSKLPSPSRATTTMVF